MINIKNLEFEERKKYSGKKAYYRDAIGMYSVEGDYEFFLSNSERYNGMEADDKKGFLYSYCVNREDRILILEDNENILEPVLEFDKLYLDGANVKFKMTPESHRALNSYRNTEGINIERITNDKLRAVRIFFNNGRSGVYCTRENCSNLDLVVPNTNRLMTVNCGDKSKAKSLFRKLKPFYAKPVVLEGKEYTVAYPIYDKHTKTLRAYAGIIQSYDVDLGRIDQIINLAFDFGILYPVKAKTVSEYKAKAKIYLLKLCFKVFKFPKDDSGDYFPLINGFKPDEIYKSRAGTEYVLARNYSDGDNYTRVFWKKDGTTLVYPDGLKYTPVYVVNIVNFSSIFSKTTYSNKWVGEYAVYRFKDSSGKVIYLDKSELEEFCVVDQSTGDYILKENAESINGHWYKKGILSNPEYFVCDSCGRIKHISNLYQTGKSKLCNGCFQETGEKFHEYYYKPKCNFHHIKGEEKTQLYLGMELEFGCEDSYNIVDVISKYFAGKENICYMKKDASVSGIELVFQPYTFKSFKEMTSKQLYPLLRKLIQLGCKGHNEGGIHLHTSLDAWDSDQLLNLYTFFYKNRKNHDFIVGISQRRKSKLDEWASLDGIDVDDEDVNYAIRDKEGDDIVDDRYRALNMTEHTLEFRIFNSSLKYTRILKNAEFVKSLYEFTKTSQPMVVDKYKDWLFKHPEGYKELIEFINEKGL